MAEVREQPRRESSAAEASAGETGLGGGQVWVGVMSGRNLMDETKSDFGKWGFTFGRILRGATEGIGQ